jgi:hypothetical protein
MTSFKGPESELQRLCREHAEQIGGLTSNSSRVPDPAQACAFSTRPFLTSMPCRVQVSGAMFDL